MVKAEQVARSHAKLLEILRRNGTITSEEQMGVINATQKDKSY